MARRWSSAPGRVTVALGRPGPPARRAVSTATPAVRADVGVVGAGIVGLAHAYAAARRGRSVIVLERDEAAAGASVRNFGLVLVTGQAAGQALELARETREAWLRSAERAGFWHRESGILVVARREEEMAVLEELVAGAPDSGHDCALLSAREVAERAPLAADGVLGGLAGRLDCRVAAREAVPAIARWLAAEHGVRFRFGAAARAVDLPRVATSEGAVEVERLVVCPGTDFSTLYPEAFADPGLTRCKLQMLRVAPPRPGFTLDPALLTGLSLVRYPAFAACPSLSALRARLERERPAALAHGVHLIVSQLPGGDLVIGDSHEYARTVSPFHSATIDALLLEEATAVLGAGALEVRERWHGVYPSAGGADWTTTAPEPGVRVVRMNAGLGMSQAFAFADRVVDELLA